MVKVSFREILIDWHPMGHGAALYFSIKKKRYRPVSLSRSRTDYSVWGTGRSTGQKVISGPRCNNLANHVTSVSTINAWNWFGVTGDYVINFIFNKKTSCVLVDNAVVYTAGTITIPCRRHKVIVILFAILRLCIFQIAFFVSLVVTEINIYSKKTFQNFLRLHDPLRK